MSKVRLGTQGVMSDDTWLPENDCECKGETTA